MNRQDTRERGLPAAGFTWQPVPVAAVAIDDAFWSSRLEINRERTIPFQYAQC
ncbi:MAG: hypothetical protein JWO59_2765, partial [Chloroflexi bacterium]|nr:hypothetical protein [Chloroflexota bacterium]